MAARAEFRKNEILEVAIDLFHTRGFHNTGMDDIGMAAGITGPGIYRHFRNKDDILDAALREGAATMMDGVHEITARGEAPDRTLLALVDNYSHQILDHPALAALVINERRLFPPAVHAWFRQADRRHMDEWCTVLGELRADASRADLEVMVRGTLGLLSSFIHYPSSLERADLQRVLSGMAMAMLIGDVKNR